MKQPDLSNVFYIGRETMRRPQLMFGLALVLLMSVLGAWQVNSNGTMPATMAPALMPDNARSDDSPEALAYMPIVQAALLLPPDPSSGPSYGLNFISSAEDPADDLQYQNGLSGGATWNRWPLYWFNVEQNPGSFNWDSADATIQADIAHGLKTQLILLGTPAFYTTAVQERAASIEPPLGMLALRQPQAATPQGLYEPVFDDGSDIPGPGKEVNPANFWAVFTFKAVNRYKPGGELAQANNWPADVGISHWEMWNEADLDIFWDSSLPDYARLVKVGYLATEQADPAAQVIFGGLANSSTRLNYYNDVMAIYDADPLAQEYEYFHDILATHSYFQVWESWHHVWRASNTLAARGLDKPIWLNESGAPAWDDYPGPIWDPLSGLRATMSEQADYVIESALFAAFGGADAIFHFQLYDGCGNQPRGTDFPPHSGELCDANGFLITDPRFPCAGDANGLFRNPTDAACFTQHPQPESPRPNYDAYKVLTTYATDMQPLWRLRPGSSDPINGPQEWIAFYKPATEERLVGMWARFGEAQTAVITATHSSGLLVAADGSTQMISPVDGFYTVQLPGATNHNAFWDPTLFAIGGRPSILIEPDTIAPETTVQASVTANGAIELTWNGDDNLGSGVLNYDVSVAIDGGPATPWLEQTTATSATYPAVPGHTYTFYASSRDQAGNVGPPASISVTSIARDQKLYLPLIDRN